MRRLPPMGQFQCTFAVLSLIFGLHASVLAEPIAKNGQHPVEGTGELVDYPKPRTLNTDFLAVMAGTCSTLSIAGRNYACRTVAFVHNVEGRVNFTIALDDHADQSHIVSFSGENGEHTAENLYDLKIDRMLLNSKSRPKADGLPIPATVTSAGRCVQLGNIASGHVLSVVCSATDINGEKYELRFESDGSPILVRRINPSTPTIRQSS